MAGKKKETLDWNRVSPLRWPQGLGRTLIGERENKTGYKKPEKESMGKIVEELRLLGANRVEITYNEGVDAQRDPGVAIWYSQTKATDTTWQTVLRVDNPTPTIDEVTKAFKRLVMENKCHPDQVAAGSGGDVKVYMKLEEAWRNAKRYIQGDNSYGLTNCLPCDMYAEVKQNLQCLRLQLMHLRAMQRLGNPFVVERIMERSFREALPAPSAEVPVGAAARS